ncbi:hypothetical protein CONPUDRAFT_91912 [Coniophora puteana RWD-64-598 SS2]|uniref:Uncharacterized protein n=1 Tax=Coniophora puteana (strain RWD-64-598) TaxID=741705 RepID=A0A5M3MIS2_CONPW|nr:uncharacterized protein CONPUDRAFT_91912 [Coniophora puteana RWD-64-598 SS2]EIW78521.1 hypothetical protein CONPUDRAFT_91912 [Coniophora puteana RWD-64-598 SS2]
MTLLTAILRCLRRASAPLKRMIGRVLFLFSYIFRLRRCSRTPSDHQPPPAVKEHSFIAAMTLPERLQGPIEASGPGTCPPPRPPSSASSGPIGICVDDSHFTPDDGRSTRSCSPNHGLAPSSIQHLSPDASPRSTSRSRLWAPSEDEPGTSNRPYGVYLEAPDHPGGVNGSTQSFTSSLTGRRPPSMLSRESVESRKGKYRSYNGSTHSIGKVTGPARSPVVSARASQELHIGQIGIPVSSNQALTMPPGRTLAPPVDGQGDSISLGTTQVAGTIELVPSEQSYDVPVAPMLPVELQRYERRGINKMTTSDYAVPCMTAYCPEHESDYPSGDSNPIPQDWQMCSHPEGAAFYYCESKRAFTDVDVCDNDIQSDVEWYIDYLHDKLKDMLACNRHYSKQQKSAIEHNSMLVVEPQLKRTAGEDEVIILYYFVNPDGRTIFWLHDTDYTFFGVEGVTQMSHKKLAITAHYWKHWDMYPLNCKVDSALVNEVKDIILHAKCDHATSKYTAGPVGPGEVNEYLSILDKIKQPDKSESNLYVSCIIGRMMFTIAYNQYLNFHGQPCARLNSNDSVYGWKYKPSLWMKVGSWLLLRAPESHVSALHDICTDGIASKHTWSDFVAGLNAQLQDFNLLATVLLNANVGFLAIQSVDNGSNPQAVANDAADPTRSWTQIASYWSLAFSIGSMILGTFLVRFHQGPEHKDAHAVAQFLKKMRSEKRGLERLAVVYSLPYALLMWGIVCFFCAFAIESCQRGQRRDFVSVGSIFGIIFGLIVYAIISILYGPCERRVKDHVSSFRPKLSDFEALKSKIGLASSSAEKRGKGPSWWNRRKPLDSEAGDYLSDNIRGSPSRGAQVEVFSHTSFADGTQHESSLVSMSDDIPLHSLSSGRPQRPAITISDERHHDLSRSQSSPT